MKPAVLNLELFKGDDYDLTLSFVDQADAPIDLTGRTFVAPVRRFADSRDVTLFTIDAAGAVGGVLGLSLASAATDLLVSGEWLLQETVGGKRHTVLGGRLAVVQEARGVAEGVTATVRLAPDVVRVVTTGTTGPQGLSGAGSGPAGGVLSGSYPDPGFAVDMATQAELDAVDAASSKKTANLSDLANAATARTNLGLGSAATHPATDFDTAGAAAAAQAASQPVDSDLTAIAALSTTAFGRGLLALADAAAGRAALALGSAATASTTDFDAAGAAAAAAAALVASAPSTLDTLNELATALGDDPNFATTITTALAGKQPLDSDLTAIAALTTTAFGRSFLALADAAAGRTLLGLDSAATHPATDFDAAGAAAAAQAASQPLDSDLTAIAALDASTAGAMATDGAGWIRKTYAQLKTALGLTKADVGLGNVDNTSDVNKPVSTAQAAADAAAVAAAEAFAVQRANHTGTQAISTVTGLQTAIDGKMQALARTAVKTASYTAVAGDLVPVDTTSGAVTVTLPNAPADKSMIAVKHIIQGGTNAVTVACAGSDVFNRTGGATTLTLALLAQGVLLEYTASAAVWTIAADDIPLAQLDARFQPLDSDLTAIAALSTTAFGRSVLDRADAAALRTLAGLVIGTDVQAYDAELAALAGLTSAADKLPYFTGSGTASLTTLSAFIRTLLAAADGPTAMATLGVKTVLKTTLETVNNSAVLQDDDQLFFAVAANETWLGMMTLFVDGGSTPDLQVAITAPAGATGIYSIYGLAATGANLAVQTGTTTTFGTALSSGVTSTGAVVVVFFEVANGSTAGNVKLQWAQQVATATDTNVRPGSNLQVRKV